MAAPLSLHACMHACPQRRRSTGQKATTTTTTSTPITLIIHHAFRLTWLSLLLPLAGRWRQEESVPVSLARRVLPSVKPCLLIPSIILLRTLSRVSSLYSMILLLLFNSRLVGVLLAAVLHQPSLSPFPINRQEGRKSTPSVNAFPAYTEADSYSHLPFFPLLVLCYFVLLPPSSSASSLSLFTCSLLHHMSSWHGMACLRNKQPNAPKRALSAYMIFSNEQRVSKR